jgi:hypothetical protein
VVGDAGATFRLDRGSAAQRQGYAGAASPNRYGRVFQNLLRSVRGAKRQRESRPHENLLLSVTDVGFFLSGDDARQKVPELGRRSEPGSHVCRGAIASQGRAASIESASSSSLRSCP